MAASSSADVFAYLVAIFIPPLAVFLKTACGVDFLINICLTILGWIPGVIHACRYLAQILGDFWRQGLKRASLIVLFGQWQYSRRNMLFVYIPILGVMRIDQLYHKDTILLHLLELMTLTTSLTANVPPKCYGVKSSTLRKLRHLDS
ncbi:hypothetical protein EYC80_001036 [Monilinia laxa]|uniref:Plasma membrane proteolipid 3 n=1 Tax=Monilinia laxa TaxID=61186 RepID=A0A5N6K7W8_MONLA|nr:hypothetical protein EYC80_001036 [Monilinia laxa]